MTHKSNSYKWELLLWLWLAFFFNQADRQIFNVVMPLIKSELALTDTELGLISSVFILTIGVFIPIAGFAGDLFNKKRVITFSLLFWSSATFFTGFSTSLLHLVLLRSLAVGGGEAFYAPSANALIGEYHQKTRALALSIHQTSLYAGVILSGLAGGYLAENYGWKAAFYVFGAIGVVLAAFMAWRIKPSVSKASETVGQKKRFVKDASLALIKNPTALLLGGAFSCLVFVNVGYLTWMPTYMHEKLGQGLAEAGFSSMFYHHAAAFVGVMAGGWLSDRMAGKTESKRLLIQISGLLLGAPFIYAMGQSGSAPGIYAGLAGFGFSRGIYEANLYATLFSVIAPGYRSTSIGLISMFAFCASAIAPFILGYLKPTFGLSDGISALSAAYVLGGGMLLAAWKFFFEKDSRSLSQ